MTKNSLILSSSLVITLIIALNVVVWVDPYGATKPVMSSVEKLQDLCLETIANNQIPGLEHADPQTPCSCASEHFNEMSPDIDFPLGSIQSDQFQDMIKECVIKNQKK